MKASRKAGFALAFAIVIFAVASFLMLGLFTMVSSSSRYAAVAMGRNRCRLAAQSAIESVKVDIRTAFERFTGNNSTVRIGPRSSTSYAWFSSGNAFSIGSGTLANGTRYDLPTTNIVINGCSVRLCFGRPCGQIGSSSEAIVSIIGRAEYTDPNGIQSASTIEERFRFAVGRSRVFDYAYFVNNYGWFQGSGCTANGDVRANGNMYLDSGCTINGEVWAARNSGITYRGAAVVGEIDGTGKYLSQSAYWSNCTAQKNNSVTRADQSRPTSPTWSGTTETWSGGYAVPTSAAARLHEYEPVGVTMPWISDLANEYVPYAQELHGSLSGGRRYSVASDGTVSSADNETINAHYNGPGPSGDASLLDNGAIVLEGTRTNPLRINGPVVVDSDVIIKGYITGQGTIYSGRNIHIVGDIIYANPPSWNHPDSNPEATRDANATKDLVGFAAKGNIVLGNCTDSAWLSSIKTYISTEPYVQRYACDSDDASIGYPAIFQGSYAALDGLQKITLRTVTEKREVTSIEKVPSTATATRTLYQNKTTGQVYTTKPYNYSSKTYTTIYKGQTYTVYTEKEVTNLQDVQVQRLANTANVNHYYDTVCYNNLITALYGSKITHVDGVLYNNHGIFGNIGECTFNGALICRNEGLIYSTSININWDIRLFSGSAEGLDNSKLGLPVGASPPGVCAWHELPESVNIPLHSSADSTSSN